MTHSHGSQKWNTWIAVLHVSLARFWRKSFLLFVSHISKYIHTTENTFVSGCFVCLFSSDSLIFVVLSFDFCGGGGIFLFLPFEQPLSSLTNKSNKVFFILLFSAMNEVIMEFRQNYTYGYIVEYIPENHTRCSSWILVPGENLWLHTTRGVIYIIAMLYIFLGIAIVSDLFMSSIEVITSQKRTVYKWDEERQERIAKEVMVWNETVANLTLLALGSSAPEILLATIENVLRLGEQSGEKNLGTFTIVGSAAFNLLMITSVCISSLPNDKVKKIKTFGVFITTSIWSLWAYIWMYIVTAFITPGVVTIWEAWVTFLYFPAFVLHAYAQDNGWWICKRKKQSPTIVTEDPPSVVSIFAFLHRDSLISF